MLTSLACIFLMGMALGWLFQRLHLPGLMGMLIAGILLGPCVLGWLDESLLAMGGELRRIALVIILMRAGLNLDISDLKQVGRPAVLMCFVPACFEICGMLLLAPYILGVNRLEAAIMGTVVAAVSPAVIVPKMLRLMEEKRGTAQGIPQMILAGASVDDVFVIVLFTMATGLAQGSGASLLNLVQVPVSIALGAAAGAVVGLLLAAFFCRVHLRDTAKVLVVLSIAFLLLAAEERLKGIVPLSGLLAVMAMGVALRRQPAAAKRLSVKFSKLWVGAEVMLFVLVGAVVDLRYAAQAGMDTILILFGVLLFRMAGVFVCLLGTKLMMRERVFCMIAYLPKATVQAAIGAVPLAMGLPCGKLVLTVAVLSILITAPLGAFGIEHTYQKLLMQQDEEKKADA